MRKSRWINGWAAVLAAAGLVAVPAQARQFDTAKPEDVLAINRKLACSATDGVPTVFWWKGNAMSRVPGEQDRVLFAVQGMNVRQCVSFKDPRRGPGYRSVSREVMLYLDPKTGEVLKTWKNPWTGKDVEVIHVQNDPVNMRRPSYAYREDGTPVEFDGLVVKGKLITSGEAPLFYPNPLAGAPEYQPYVGGSYHAMEMINFYADAKQVLDSRVADVTDLTISWARVSQWLPWMDMGDRPGLVFFSTVGKKVSGIDALSEPLRGEILRNYPLYREPPPADDARPNETTWSFVKKVLDARRAAAAAAKPAQ
ncbi:MAG: DUF1838 family protein [Gammaproteobacteria bacterium]|nr:DUF1838 family protein [Gammaproteobacteria bacterium]